MSLVASAGRNNTNNMMHKKEFIRTRSVFSALILFLLVLGIIFTICGDKSEFFRSFFSHTNNFDIDAFLLDPPQFDGNAITEINGNTPLFTKEEIALKPGINYSSLDALGRCGPALGLLGPETIPQEKRGIIGDVRPSGWHTVRYDDRIEDRYLYNRCHLIGYQLAGDNADPQNLITGTRYLNMSGMLPYENLVFSYISRTGNHVLYRVRPIFVGENLLASGVLMEAYSIEDHGKDLSFCIYAHNVQPGVVIDYLTGESSADDQWISSDQPKIDTNAESELLMLEEVEALGEIQQRSIEDTETNSEITYILNTNTKRFHDPSCPSAQETKEKNKKNFYGSREEAIAEGYIPCGRCKP